MNTQDEKKENAQTAAYNPFPEPQTIPAGWDTSEFLTAPQPVLETDERNSVVGLKPSSQQQE